MSDAEYNTHLAYLDYLLETFPSRRRRPSLWRVLLSRFRIGGR